MKPHQLMMVIVLAFGLVSGVTLAWTESTLEHRLRQFLVGLLGFLVFVLVCYVYVGLLFTLFLLLWKG